MVNWLILSPLLTSHRIRKDTNPRLLLYAELQFALDHQLQVVYLSKQPIFT